VGYDDYGATCQVPAGSGGEGSGPAETGQGSDRSHLARLAGAGSTLAEALPRLSRDQGHANTDQVFTIRDLSRLVPHPVSKPPCGEQSSSQKDNISLKQS
jgi:hypothetical protein